MKQSINVFLSSLLKTNFKGDIEDSYGARIVASTDNSVYQVIPEAIIYPRVADDINIIVTLLSDFKTSGFSIVARGGGTGTNGQSLNKSIVLDTSRYLNKIISLDKESNKVIVEPGVVLDQLNAYLAEFGLFFPPDVSSSSRATIGGMVATDASGKGSRVYGKTSDYIEQMDVVLSDGSDFTVTIKEQSEIKNLDKNDLAKRAQIKVFEVIRKNEEKISQIFPKMNRGLTGYNLEHVFKESKFRLSYLLAGSEGTLALTKRLVLRVIPKPRKRALVAVMYSNFEATLDHIPYLLKANPTAIEVLDDKVLELAQKDAIWQDVKKSFGKTSLDKQIKGLNFIEVTGDTDSEITKQCAALELIINKTGDDFKIINQIIENNPDVIKGLWGIRKRAVGLLGALEGERQPTAFVEDTAVPPEKLPAFIKDFRLVLKKYGLDFGMYGHADVGCLHVRPALNMKKESDQKLIRSVTDEIALLTKQYGGLLWGEHGRGFRGEYSPLFFGDELYPLLQEIKAAFDPNNFFNPGKLATPSTELSVTKIDKIPFRGSYDSQIVDKGGDFFQSALNCNGNAACFSWDYSEAMCPSYKATKDKRFSPKGRAAMLREWLRLSANKNDQETLVKLEEECFQSLEACLSCKSCTHSCPIKVDVPELKSHFLESYYSNRRRPLKDSVFASFEAMSYFLRKLPSLANKLSNTTILEKTIGVTALPKYSASLNSGLKKRHTACLSLERLPTFQEKSVILLPDSFTGSFDTQIILAGYDVMTAMGFKVFVAPILNNGKALHVKGYREKFKKVARQHVSHMKALASTGMPLISLEVVTRLMHRKEYKEVISEALKYEVISIESWLSSNLPEVKQRQQNIQARYQLLPHCMEQTADKQSYSDWKSIFEKVGLECETAIAGCCGMSGLFGHELQNKALSENIYQNSWAKHVTKEKELLATGFSCRCQLHNHGHEVKHPIEVLAELYQSDQ